MSTNRKNRTGPAILRNQVRGDAITGRALLDLSANINSKELSATCEELNSYIQQLNCMIAERFIPYFSIVSTTEPYNLGKTRVVLRTEMEYQVKRDAVEALRENSENTHLVEIFLCNNGYLEIGYIDESETNEEKLDGCILADFEYLPCVLIDIFLDSAIFSSYSFLKELPAAEKRAFNRKKVEFILRKFGPLLSTQETNDWFYTFQNDDYSYLSLSFFARKSEMEVDLEYLSSLWAELVKKYYPINKHKAPPVQKQIECFCDYGQLSPAVTDEICNLTPYTYWLIRICRDCSKNEKTEKQLDAVFGSHEIGKTKVKPFEDFPLFEQLLQDRWITAFKVVVQ